MTYFKENISHTSGDSVSSFPFLNLEIGLRQWWERQPWYLFLLSPSSLLASPAWGKDTVLGMQAHPSAISNKERRLAMHQPPLSPLPDHSPSSSPHSQILLRKGPAFLYKMEEWEWDRLFCSKPDSYSYKLWDFQQSTEPLRASVSSSIKWGH
jgi:hypothetical protein